MTTCREGQERRVHELPTLQISSDVAAPSVPDNVKLADVAACA